MSIYKSIECSNIYSKTLGSLWQYYRDEAALNNAGDDIYFLLIIVVFHSNLKKK